MTIYQPAEDSYLLLSHIREFCEVTSVLDMGTGSGIQAAEAARYAKSVLAVDIDPKSVEYVKKLGNQKIKAVQSDLFEKVPPQKFGLILFNPPYLPEEGLKDMALFSAKRGTETAMRFLEKASEYLEDDGTILLISSSLASQSLLKQAFGRHLLDAAIIDKVHIFFEDIILYKLTKSHALLMLNSRGFKDSTLHAKGKRGIIIKAKKAGRDLAVKLRRPQSSAPGTLQNEARILKIVNKHGIGPKLIMAEEDFLAMEFIDGTLIEDFFADAARDQIMDALRSVISQLKLLDNLEINKFEMHRPHKHIIISKNGPVLIDFERARNSEDPKNITQFLDYLSSGRILGLLEAKGIRLDRPQLIEKGKIYKKTKELLLF